MGSKNSKKLDEDGKDTANDLNNNDKDKTKDENEEKKEEELPPAGFFTLYRYATQYDKILLTIGIIFAMFSGGAFPAMVIGMGKITDTFIEYQFMKGICGDNQTIIDGRHQYYLTNWKDLNNDTLYFKELEVYFGPTGNEPLPKEIQPETLRTRFGYTIPEMVNLYNKSVFNDEKLYVDNFKRDSMFWSLGMGAVAVLFAVCNFIMVSTFAQSAKNQVYNLKLRFFRSILQQEMSWYDTKKSSDFATKITADLDLVQEGIGDKVALTIFAFTTVIVSLAVAFTYGWELTLIIMAVMPVAAISFAVLGKIQSRYSATESSAYSKAGAIAEEAFRMVRTVFAFGGQDKEVKRYEENIIPARDSGIKRSAFTGGSMLILWISIYSSYGVAFYFGVKFILRSMDHPDKPKYDASTLLIVFFNVMMGTFSMGQTAPYFEAISRARGAAAQIFKILEQVPLIDCFSNAGEKPQHVKGHVEFRNIHFSYPSRSTVPILKGLHLEAQPGQTIALVGPSGCGKSTIVQLIQRLYDPASGDIFLDGKNIRDLNVGALRDRIGVVGQEPVLFGYLSILENIRLGNPDATNEDIYQAAKDANAYSFIDGLPSKFDTLVGEAGSQLSGGQKQRIAIARALVRKPKILLLDESTSALDSASEAIVQAALEKAAIGRTTFVVAHRLSTIKNAHKIIVIRDGSVVETGTHNELIEAKGLYHSMASLQYQNQELKNSSDSDDNSNGPLEKALEDDEDPPAYEMEVGGDGKKRRFSAARQVSVIRSRKGTVVSSNGDVEIQAGKPEVDPEKDSLPISKVIDVCRPDMTMIVIATISSFVVGLSIPCYSFLFGEILGVISSPDRENIENKTWIYSWLFVAMGVVTGALNFIQIFFYGKSSENLTYRLRKDIFRKLLQQDVEYFDHKDNSTGALCARLSTDASAVNGATGIRLSTIAQLISILLAGCGLSLYYCWKLGLVLMAFIPLLFLAVKYQAMQLGGMNKSKVKVAEEASKIAVESISNIRTVASLHSELEFWTRYEAALTKHMERTKWETVITSLGFAFAQVFFNIAYSVALFYGSRLIISGEIDYKNLFKSTEAIIFGTNMIGQSFVHAPQYQKGRIAFIRIFALFESVPKIALNAGGRAIAALRGDLAFRDIFFRYPTRPEARVLRGLSLTVQKGQTIALVGSSGCGKSTVIQLLQRFYDPISGNIAIDGESMGDLSVPWLRSQIGIVSQEPHLFNTSIFENIAYGDNSRAPGMDEIVRAAEAANIHSFIKELPDGYDTKVGDKGAQLSGGQKQRIAIARALLRNPKILLLDEATSALDSESEKVVQDALDDARQGRTCIIIAHRLSTIQNVDQIVVIVDGVVAETGTHDELLERRGAYYQMYTAQVGQI